MHLSNLKYYFVCSLFLGLYCSPVVAQDLDQLDWTTTKDKWGQLLFCQRIYTLPEVRGRLYRFDLESCDKAGKLVDHVISRYSPQQQAQLKGQAEQHSFRLGENTSEPYLSVPACREYCSRLAEIQDQIND
jgi:hypothetical protein